MAGLKLKKKKKKLATEILSKKEEKNQKQKTRGRTLSSDNTCNPNNTGKKREEMVIFY